ncbi:hypothetical protein [Anaerococcus hydrogenalis]|uniref:hypothetical protein n=1 Tax=Anaerococcus hydrogenalis TaxID=33029 RepID=UPI001D2B472D|nr:hypothetical protein [Anaerococcus hydrogenalis]MBS5989682.1 hypothetical protein [Anaerococcus hydrogenalis]
MKRSEKYRNFKEFGLPRYLMLNEKDKKRESIMWVSISVLLLVLVLLGRNELIRNAGAVSLFFVNLLGVLSR